jgi:uncharacterized protein YqgC (DUF456 family)
MDALTDAMAFSLATAVMLIGLVGVAVPVVPGVVLIWIAALGYAWYDGFHALSPLVFALLTLLGVAGATSDVWMSYLGARVGGASLWATLGGTLGSLIGLVVWFPLGAIVGSVVGALLVELIRTRDWRKALMGGGGTLGGRLMSTAVELLIGLAMIGLFLLAVLGPAYLRAR